MQDFQKYKKSILEKNDKSSKGKIDIKIQSLCDTLNKHPSILTLSSCSGRICILEVIGQNNKKLSNWLYITHELTSFNEIEERLKNFQNKSILTFKQESTILHIAFENLQIGERFLKLAKRCGFNRCGFISTQKKVVLECILSMPINLPIYDTKLLITKKYLEYLIENANEKQKACWKIINKLEEEFKNEFQLT